MHCVVTVRMTQPERSVSALQRVVASSPWLTEVLLAVRDVEAALGQECWVAAGAVRDLVWDVRYGGRDPLTFDATCVKDVDVGFFDPTNLEPSADQEVQSALERRRSDVPWEAKNQAAVHRWYERRFGYAVEPLTSMAAAVATYPETSTAVAVRLSCDGRLDVLAPLGLEDLLKGVYRRNPRRVNPEHYRRRMAAKRPAERWPGVRVELL